MDKLEDLMLEIRKVISFSDDEIKGLDRKLAALNEFNNRLSRTAERNGQGIAYEKEGNIKDAIRVYEENIKDGYPATHSFERLMIRYHRQEEYDQEIRVIERAFEVFGPVKKWQKRLDRLHRKLKIKQ